MSFSTFYTGVSGLKSYQTAIDITSNNIANSSTIGFRGYNTEFSTLYENSIHAGAGHANGAKSKTTVGGGVKVQASTMSLEQGSLRLSEKSTDLAIAGDGWFGVQNTIQDGKPLYTRDGGFSFNKNGDLVTNDAHYVLGTIGKNVTGNVLSSQLAEIPLDDVNAQQKLRFPTDLTFPVIPSTIARFSGNLGLKDELQTMSAKVIDAQGINNEIKLIFKKSANQVPPGVQWDISATALALDGSKIYDTKTGTINFDNAGKQVSNTLDTINNNGVPVTIELDGDFGSIYSSNFAISSASVSDGNIAGKLIGYDINANADVIASFTNGKHSSVAKIAIYHFANDQGLSRASSSKFAQSNNSGKPIFFKNDQNENITGAILTNFKLENSNVKIEVALTDLIVYQRAYDANSKIVSTSDQMIQKALQMGA
jgi:flagellar hook protein FlgE